MSSLRMHTIACSSELEPEVRRLLMPYARKDTNGNLWSRVNEDGVIFLIESNLYEALSVCCEAIENLDYTLTVSLPGNGVSTMDLRTYLLHKSGEAPLSSTLSYAE